MKDRVWRKKISAAVLGSVLLCGAWGGQIQAAAVDAKTAEAYDYAANIKENMSCFDVTVTESTTIPGQTDDASKTVHMKVSGLQTENMRVSMTVTTDEGEKNQYYANGYLYTDQSGEKIKYKIEPAEMLELMNYDVYLNFDSGRLAALESSEKNGETVYTFSATQETVGDYVDKILEGAQKEHQVEIITVQGTMEVSENNSISERELQTVYMVQKDGRKQACIMTSEAKFNAPGETVVVTMPDLSQYKEQGKQEATVEITEKYQTIYATDSVNIRAQNSITAAILGGASTGTALQQTGYTSDGWIQIFYNGAAGYVSAEYTSTTKPIVVADMSGTMYATTGVYVRNAAGTDGTILGSLSTGDSVKVTGYTDNGWIRVKYQGAVAYVFADYLTWEEPAEVVGGYLTGTITDVSSKTITIKTADGTSYTLDTSKAYMNVVDGLVEGDRADIAYNKQGSKLIATQVNDYTYHENAEVDPEEVADMIFGVVMANGMNSITVSCDDGTSMTFVKGDAVVKGSVYVGAYVSAAFYYDKSIGAYCLTYMSVI